jgi:hypothetical protein
LRFEVLIIRIENTFARIGDQSEFEGEVKSTVLRYKAGVKYFAKLMIEQFSQDRADLGLLSEAFEKVNRSIILGQTWLNNMIDEGRILPNNEFGRYLYARLRKLPQLIRTANRLQAEYYRKTGTCERPGFSLPSDEMIEKEFLLPFQYDIVQAQRTHHPVKNRRLLGETLARTPTMLGGLLRTAAGILY